MFSGETLRARREALGYTVAEVAAATKIPVRFLEALEEGRLADLPAGPYAATYTRSVSVYLGLQAPEPDPGDSQDARPVHAAPLWVVRGTATAALFALGGMVLWFGAVFATQALTRDVERVAQKVEVSAVRKAKNVVVTSPEGRRAVENMIVGKDPPIVVSGDVITVEADNIGSISVTWNGAKVEPRGRTSGRRILRFVDDAGGR